MAEYQYFTILISLNVLFFLNHFLVRHLRKKLDKQAIVEEEAVSLQKPARRKKKKSTKISCLTRLQGYGKGFLIGLLHKEKNQEPTFIGWKPLKHNVGKLTTAALLIGAALILSQDFLDLIGIPRVSGGSVELCTPSDFENGLKELNATLDSAAVTNLPVARRQFTHTNNWLGVLRTAVTLYGEDGNNCQTPSSSTNTDCICNNDLDGNGSPEKKSPLWDDGSGNPTDKAIQYGNYFPGICLAANENAILRIKSQTCTTRKCVCKKILGVCWGGKTKHCFDQPVDCPASTLDASTEEGSADNYRQAQLARERELLEQDLENTLTNYEEAATEKGEEVLNKILYQVDIAGTFYIVYVATAMFFPCALKVFRVGMATDIKHFVFGAHRFTFIAIVVAAWWGFEYFYTVAIDPELQLYWKNLFGNPCFGDADFLQARQDLVTEKCAEIVPMADQHQLESLTIDHIREGWYDMKSDTCCGRFPAKTITDAFGALSGVPNNPALYLDDAEAAELGFNRFFFESGVDFTGTRDVLRSTVRFQNENKQAFLGNDTLCMDQEYAQQFIEPPETDVDWFQVWIGSGLLATIFVKVSLSNFCVSLMYFADPLALCDGKYEYPPERFITDDSREALIDLKHLKIDTLKAKARRSVYTWGVIFNMCLLNLALSTFGTPSL